MATAAHRSDERLIWELVDGTIGQPTLGDFRERLYERLHALVDPVFAVLATRLVPGGPAEIVPSRLHTAEDLATRDADCYREQAAFLDQPPALARMVASEIPAPLLAEMATTQLVWPRYGIREAVGVPLDTDNGARGFLTLTLEARLPKRVDRALDLIERLGPYLRGMLGHYAELARLRARADALDALALAAGPAILVDAAGRPELVTPAALTLFRRLTGKQVPPRAVLAACAVLLRDVDRRSGNPIAAARRRPVIVGGRTLSLRPKLVGVPGGFMVLALLAAPPALRPALLDEQARLAGLTERQRAIVRLVAAGRLNKQIAARLGIAEQTVKNHLKEIFRRTGAHNRAHLVRLMLEGSRP
jgi:DNA-binding CsgD family transcriptional regulator